MRRRAPAAHADRARHRRGRARGRGLRATATRTPPSPCCASPTAWARAAHLAHAAYSSLPVVPTILGLRPALSVHPRGRHGRLPRARGPQRPRRRVQLRRRRRARRFGGHRPARQADGPDPAAVGTGLAAVGAAPRRRAASRRRCCASCASAAALDNRRLKATGFRYRYTTREAVLKLREHQRLRRSARRSAEGYRYERGRRGVPALQPERPPANAAPQPPRNVAAGGAEGAEPDRLAGDARAAAPFTDAAQARRTGSSDARLRRPRGRGGHRTARSSSRRPTSQQLREHETAHAAPPVGARSDRPAAGPPAHAA